MAPRTRVRLPITAVEIQNVQSVSPASAVGAITGVRVYDVGQGDGIAVLNQAGKPFLQIDYGGREGSPFRARRASAPDSRMPTKSIPLLMLTHWDEDHWCSARLSADVKQCMWLVPRQLASPRAVNFSVKLDSIYCVPEASVGKAQAFVASNGDAVIWEKVGPFPGENGRHEDCNLTGIAFSILREKTKEVILIPGDAPFDRVSHYGELSKAGTKLRALIASHHGSSSHWSAAAGHLLSQWPKSSSEVKVCFSCSMPNAYGHPSVRQYRVLLPRAVLLCTNGARRAGRSFVDLRF